MQSEKVKVIFQWGRRKKRFMCLKSRLKNRIAKRLDLATEFSLEVLKKDSNEWVPVTPSDVGDMDEIRIANLEEILKSEGKVNGVSEDDDDDSSSDEEMCDTLRKKLKENIALDAAEKRFLCDVLWCRPKRQMKGSSQESPSEDSYKSECDCKRRKMEDKYIQTIKDDDDEDEGKTRKPGRGRPRKETSNKEKEVVKKPQRGRGRPKKSSTAKQEEQHKKDEEEEEEEDMEVETVAKKKNSKTKSKRAVKTSDAESADDDDDEKQEKKEAKKNDEPKASRGRGRPRKSTSTKIEEPEGTEKEVGAKKSRGRNRDDDDDDKARGVMDESDGDDKEDEEPKESNKSKVKLELKGMASKDKKDDDGLSSDSDLLIELKTKSPSPHKKDKDKQKTNDDGMFSSSSGSEFAVKVIPNKKKPGELAMSSDSDDETSKLKGKKKGKEKKGRGRKKKEESSDAGSDYEPPKAKNYDEGTSESDTEVKKGKRRSVRVERQSSASPKKGRKSSVADRKKSSGSKKRKKGDDSFSDTDDDSSSKRKSRRQSKAPKTYAERDSSGASDRDANWGSSSTKRKSRSSKNLREEESSEKSESEEKSDSRLRGKKQQKKTKSEGKKKKEDTAKTTRKSVYKQVKEMREHMIAELKKDSPDDDKIRKLMDETFRARQDYILNDTPRIKVVRETYPALFNIKEVIREFNRIKEEDNYKKYKKNLETYADIILENVPSTSSPVVDIVKEKLDEDLSDEEKDYVKSAAVILLLPAYLKEDVRNFISFVKVTESVFPLITCSVPLEKVLSSDAQFTILVEMHKLCTSASLVEAFFAFISAFYIFNIEFPEECTQTISVIESLLLEITSEVCLSKKAQSAKKLFCSKLKENEKRAVSEKEDKSCDKKYSSKQNDDGDDKEETKDVNSDASEKSTEKRDGSDERKKDDSEASDQ